MIMLVDTIGVTLLEPLLAALPKPLQRLRVGPLASPEKYSARDWAITNILCMSGGLLYLAVFWTNLTLCGWSPDAWPWNIQGYPEAEYPDSNCDLYVRAHQTFWQKVPLYDRSHNISPGAIIGWVVMTGGPLAVPCVLLKLARKLPGWGEPPLPKEAESTTQPAKPPPEEAKVEEKRQEV